MIAIDIQIKNDDSDELFVHIKDDTYKDYASSGNPPMDLVEFKNAG